MPNSVSADVYIIQTARDGFEWEVVLRYHGRYPKKVDIKCDYIYERKGTCRSSVHKFLRKFDPYRMYWYDKRNIKRIPRLTRKDL